MEINQETHVQNEEFSMEIFNVSRESDDIEIKLDENFEALTDMVGRRC